MKLNDIKNEVFKEEKFMGEKIYSELEQKILNEAGVEYAEKKEQVDLIKSELEQKISIKSNLSKIMVNTDLVESKIVLNYLEKSGCMENKEFKNLFLNSCNQNLLNIA